MNKKCLRQMLIQGLKCTPKMVISKQVDPERILYKCGQSCECGYYGDVTEPRVTALKKVIQKHNRIMFELKRDRDREAGRRPNASQAGPVPRPAGVSAISADWIRTIDNQPIVRTFTAEEMRRLHGDTV